MTLLGTGLLLWTAVHVVPGLVPRLKSGLVAVIGLGPYRGIFALLVLTALTLIVMGWRTATPTYLYHPLAQARYLTMGLMAIAAWLLVCFAFPSNVKRVVRHPQLTAIAIWAVAHLISNGDSRSVVLFGGLGLWAVVEMIVINRRQGPRTPPGAVPLWRDLIVVVGALVAYLALLFAHPYFTGAAIL